MQLNTNVTYRLFLEGRVRVRRVYCILYTVYCILHREAEYIAQYMSLFSAAFSLTGCAASEKYVPAITS